MQTLSSIPPSASVNQLKVVSCIIESKSWDSDENLETQGLLGNSSLWKIIRNNEWTFDLLAYPEILLIVPQKIGPNIQECQLQR